MSKEFLRQLPLFVGLKEPDLDRLSEAAEPMVIEKGHLLVEEGEPADSLYVVLDGEFEVTKRVGDEEIVLSVRRAGEVIGEISLLDQSPRSATVRALQKSRVLMVSQAAFQQVLACSPSAVAAVLQTVTSRLRSTEMLLVQNKKMAALGKLAAGLAHELNNPAAAVRRSSVQLREVLTEWQRWSTKLDALALSKAQMEDVSRLREKMGAHVATTTTLDSLARSDKEVEVQEWLEGHAVERAWELAPALVTLGWGEVDLRELEGRFSPAGLPVVVPWLTSGSLAYALLDEVGEGAQRISAIVNAIKSYSHLDQAPVQEVDIHEGLDNTLVILKHKLAPGITVKREYGTEVPRIECYPNELNQVWTNIIDNAVDAMQGRGEITLCTYAKDSQVIVEISDTGPGIPPEVLPHIFEPFYTTKGPGSGTGLGLHIAYNIVVDKHRGRIGVKSRPGETSFQIRLPTQLPRE